MVGFLVFPKLSLPVCRKHWFYEGLPKTHPKLWSDQGQWPSFSDHCQRRRPNSLVIHQELGVVLMCTCIVCCAWLLYSTNLQKLLQQSVCCSPIISEASCSNINASFGKRDAVYAAIRSCQRRIAHMCLCLSVCAWYFARDQHWFVSDFCGRGLPGWFRWGAVVLNIGA